MPRGNLELKLVKVTEGKNLWIGDLATSVHSLRNFWYAVYVWW